MDTLLDLPMRGKFYGVRGSFPSADPRIGGHTTCHTMQFGDTLIVFDTGSGMIDLGRELMKPYLMPGKTINDVDVFMDMYIGRGLPINKIGQALVNAGLLGKRKGLKLVVMHSHVHGDHLYGIQAFKPIFLNDTQIHFISATHDGLTIPQVMEQFVFRGPVFPVPWAWISERCTHQLVGHGDHFEIPCSIGGPIKVWCLKMKHPNDAYGFRFEWGGKKIAITLDHEHGDPEYDENIVKLWEGADIVVTEAQYTDTQYELCKGFGHISESAAGIHAREAQPGRIITTHHDPDSDYGTVRDIARTIERLSGVRTEFATQGTVF